MIINCDHLLLTHQVFKGLQATQGFNLESLPKANCREFSGKQRIFWEVVVLPPAPQVGEFGLKDCEDDALNLNHTRPYKCTVLLNSLALV